MQLDPQWRDILRKAWSVRFIILAGILSACEAVLYAFPGAMPAGPYAALMLVTTIAALVARVTAQKDLSK